MLSGVGRHDAREQIGGGLVVPGVSGEDLEGGSAVMTVDPAENVPHGVFSEGGGVDQRGKQRTGPLAPVVFGTPHAGRSRGTDHGVGGDDGRVPFDFAVVNGDQPTRSTPGGHFTSPLGS